MLTSYCTRLSLLRSLKKHDVQVEAHKAAQKKIIEAYDPHKDAVFCRDLFAGLGMSSRVNQTVRTLVSIGCQPTKND